MASLRRKTSPPRGIVLGPGRSTPDGEPVLHLRFEAPLALQPWVEHLWLVRWRLPPGEIFEAATLPHPVAHWTIEAGRNEVLGVHRGRYVRQLRGGGRVVAVKFRPAGLCAFWEGSLHTLTDRTVSAARVLGPAAEAAGRDLDALTDEEAAARLAQALSALDVRRDPDAEGAKQIVEHVAGDRELTRVEAVARRFGISVLALERLFRARVGVSPKWVIQRYRLHEALDRVAAVARSPSTARFAGLAYELGFTDQAHFCRVFKRFIGESPTAWAARVNPPRSVSTQAG